MVPTQALVLELWRSAQSATVYLNRMLNDMHMHANSRRHHSTARRDVVLGEVSLYSPCV